MECLFGKQIMNPPNRISEALLDPHGGGHVLEQQQQTILLHLSLDGHQGPVG